MKISTGPNSGIIYVLAGDATVFDPSVSKIDTKFLGMYFIEIVGLQVLTLHKAPVSPQSK